MVECEVLNEFYLDVDVCALGTYTRFEIEFLIDLRGTVDLPHIETV